MTYLVFRSKSKNLYLKLEYNHIFGKASSILEESIIRHITNWFGYFHESPKDLEITISKDSMRDV